MVGFGLVIVSFCFITIVFLRDNSRHKHGWNNRCNGKKTNCIKTTWGIIFFNFKLKLKYSLILKDEINSQQRRTSQLLRGNKNYFLCENFLNSLIFKESAVPPTAYPTSRAGSKAAFLYNNDNNNADSRFGSRMALLPSSNVDISAYSGSFLMRPSSKIPLPPLGKSMSSIFDLDKNKGIFTKYDFVNDEFMSQIW